MTVAEVLAATGLTEEQIKAIDAKAMEGFTKVLSTAEEAKAAAELAKRATAEQYEKEIVPALDAWGNEKAQLEAKAVYYQTLAEKAKEAGFIAGVEPFKPATGSEPVRGQDGKFVANAGAVPGSPQFMTKEEGYRAVSSAQWYVSEYMRLHNGAPPPVDMEVIAQEATRERIPFRDYVEKKFEFGKRREELKAKAQKEHDDKVRAEAVAENDKKWAERVGSNPAVRIAETSRFSEINKAVKDKQRPDPLTMTREQRHAVTAGAIQKEIAENETVQ